jgi:LacI family transcriptional regulator
MDEGRSFMIRCNMKRNPRANRPAAQDNQRSVGPHVLLLIETSRTYGRDLLRGVRRYIAEQGPWSVYMELRALESEAPPWLAGWHGDGILVRSGSKAMVDAVARTKIPAVELRASTFGHHAPFVGVDNAALGEIVAAHLIERGLRHFAVYALDTEEYFQQRRDNFVATLQRLGHSCGMFHAPRRQERPRDWEKHQAALAAWVAGLPKPAGVMACTDQLGFWLLDACRRVGVSVPEEVAVVGVENEESLCTMASPPLSSVQYDGQRIGYEAASLLGRMMRGEPPPEHQTLFPPVGIVQRASSDVVAIDDGDVSEALRYIRRRACDGISVEDVLAAAQTSRSTLERRMRALIGRTPKDEILRVQFNRVRELLTFTDLPLAEIAGRSGFRHPQYLAEAFKKRFGQTPGRFRTSARRTPHNHIG